MPRLRWKELKRMHGASHRVGCLLSMIGMCAALTSAVLAFAVDDLPRVRCVSNYLFQNDTHDVSVWERDLDDMKQAGLNTVWMVNVWGAYQPDVGSGEWREDRIEALRGICAAAREREMDLLLVLAYIGEGWGPKGVDVPAWPLIEEHREQHLTFLRRMARETRDFDNVFYLLCSEEILPATVLYRPNEREECVQSFRAWARNANPDVSYWNQRWASEYTWENLTPVDTKQRPRWQIWADHWRWFGHLMRELLPPMVAAIREEKPGAIIGYHDFLLPMGLDLTAKDGGLELPTPFDFYSIGYYYKHKLEGAVEENLGELRKRVECARGLYPSLPVFCGELGMDVMKKPAERRREEERLQAEFLTRSVAYLQGEGIGFSLWSWRTVIAGDKRIHSLTRQDGTERPALKGLREMWSAGDDNEGKD